MRTKLATMVGLSGALFGGFGCSSESKGDSQIERTLLSLEQPQRERAGEENRRYIVSFRDRHRGPHTLRSVGARSALNLPSIGASAVYLDSHAVRALQSNPNVVDLEADVKRYPLSQSIPYGIRLVEADSWDFIDSSNTTVCVIDSGLWGAHEDLQTSWLSASPDNGTGDPLSDGCGHGSHVAGTIAALDNTVGVVGVNGSGSLNLHIVKVFGDDCGWAYSSSLIAAVQSCQQDSPTGANLVLNMSLGGSRKSRSEERALRQVFASGTVLSVAAAGNDGSTRKSYPASYDSVISVAAVGSSMALADFSQRNGHVELAAPGVAVQSVMMPGAAIYSPAATLSVALNAFEANAFEGSALGSAVGQLVDCGTEVTQCQPQGGICLVQRGAISFAEKVQHCNDQGGVGAIIYNNIVGPLLGTLGDAPSSIPVLGVRDEDGVVLMGLLGEVAALNVDASIPYATLNGTSMATPHVSGGAALLWSHFPDRSNAQVRAALQQGALDLGVVGEDDSYGYGLLQLRESLTVLASELSCSAEEQCGEPEEPVSACKASGKKCNDSNDCCSGVCVVGGGGPPRCH